MSITCQACGRLVPPERVAALPETRHCVSCAATAVGRKRGAMVYDHKTAGSLAVFADASAFQHYKATFGRVGQQSILRRVSPSKS
jgi:hypothetical protein